MVATHGTARAEGMEEAQAKYEEALTLFDQLQFAKAIPLFRDAFKVTGSPNASLYIARCHRELGELPAAYEAFREAMRVAATRASSEPRFEETRDAALTEMRALEERVARVYISIEAPPPNMTVTLGEIPVPSERLGTVDANGTLNAPSENLPEVRAPGAIELSASAPGHATYVQQLDLASGAPQRVTIPPLSPEAATAPVPLPDEPDGSSDGGTQRTIGLITAGVGGVGLVMGTIFGISALGKQSEGDEFCDGSQCTQQGLDLHDDANSVANISNVSFGVGIALVATGAILYFAADGDDSTEASVALSVLPLTHPRSSTPIGGMVGMVGRFE